MIFRSPIIAILPLIVIALVSQVATGLISDVNKALNLNADSSVATILIVVLFGIGTDYILFLMFRYRERLRAGDDAKQAMVNAVARVGEVIASAWQRGPEAARFTAIGAATGRRPGVFAAVSGLVLIALAITDPTQVYLHATSGTLTAAEITEYGAKLKTMPGVGTTAAPMVSKDGATAEYTVTLSCNPQSTQAVNVLKNELVPAAHAAAPPGTYALVGGTTSVSADIQRAVNHDYAVVFPVAAVIILLILALLLRSLVAPWYLMISVGLGFAATLGASVLVFQTLAGQAGLVFLLPVYMYLFVAALGTDHNILMIARLREQAREGMPRGRQSPSRCGTPGLRSVPPASSWPGPSPR